MRKHGQKKKKIQASFEGSCTLVFILSRVPKGTDLMTREIASGYIPATACRNMKCELTINTSRWGQEWEPDTSSSKEWGTGCGNSSNLSDNKNQTQTFGRTLIHDYVPHPMTHKTEQEPKRVPELHWVAQSLPLLAFFQPEVQCPRERWFGLPLNMYLCVISAPQSASSLWRMKWTVLAKSHSTQVKGAPQEVAVSQVDGMKWSQVSRAGKWACGWPCAIYMCMGGPHCA